MPRIWAQMRLMLHHRYHDAAREEAQFCAERVKFHAMRAAIFSYWFNEIMSHNYHYFLHAPWLYSA